MKNKLKQIIKLKFNLTDNLLIFLISFHFAIILNLAIWSYSIDNLVIDSFSVLIFAISLPIVMFIVQYVCFNLLLFPYTFKPITIFLLLVSSATNYFMLKYKVYIDSGMIQNTFETNMGETLDLITFGLISYIFITGVIPSILLLKTNIIYTKKQYIQRVKNVGIAFAVLFIFFLTSYKQYAMFGRNHKDVNRLINPGNYIQATTKYFKKKNVAKREFMYIDKEATLKKSSKNRLIVLIIGETARSENFSLNGYKNKTNPLLEKQNIVSFKDVKSAGTATAYSVPAIFSSKTRSDFEIDYSDQEENLLDLMQQVGYDVLWLENDNGCKGVCQRIKTIYYKADQDKKLCDGKYCFDEIMLKDFKDKIKNIKKDTIIVFHTIGSHGPTYYKRYPENFKKFVPTCDTAELQNCPRENIVNAYDNTILYTDYFINNVIEILKKQKEQIALLYVSDHGESLGENGVYLHGMPYKIAPDQQKQVPMIFWSNYIDLKPLKKKQNSKLSHDNIFHTILKIGGVESKAYNKKLDLLY
ncbi:MAG: phosphoethanolamine--lipid A transferase [Rickettsiales bacterium]|nr:MAG: phosphoethanolamine--lipid A transferase [Rickettsiales bacterium]